MKSRSSEYALKLYYSRRRDNMLYVTRGKTPQCANCGAVENLEFDHIDPSEKSFNVSIMKSLRDESFREELDKCQLLCNGCHREKTALERSGFTHGTVYGFQKMKCQCEKCESKKSEYEESRNARRRAGESGRPKYGRQSRCGELLHYRRGCRCDSCKAANSEYSRMLYSRKIAK